MSEQAPDLLHDLPLVGERLRRRAPPGAVAHGDQLPVLEASGDHGPLAFDRRGRRDHFARLCAGGGFAAGVTGAHGRAQSVPDIFVGELVRGLVRRDDGRAGVAGGVAARPGVGVGDRLRPAPRAFADFQALSVESDSQRWPAPKCSPGLRRPRRLQPPANSRPLRATATTEPSAERPSSPSSRASPLSPSQTQCLYISTAVLIPLLTGSKHSISNESLAAASRGAGHTFEHANRIDEATRGLCQHSARWARIPWPGPSSNFPLSPPKRRRADAFIQARPAPDGHRGLARARPVGRIGASGAQRASARQSPVPHPHRNSESSDRRAENR